MRLACKTEIVEVPLAQVLPMRMLDDSVRKSVKYKCIEASIRELGLIEPLVIFPTGGRARWRASDALGRP